jgi:hypothetical protein
MTRRVFARYREGLVAEPIRICHAITLAWTADASPDDMVTALCGQVFPRGVLELTPTWTGTPCCGCVLVLRAPSHAERAGTVINTVRREATVMDQHDDPGLSSIDTSVPSVARMYDYYLGGKDNFQVDRDTVHRMLVPLAEIRQAAQENRAFLRRAVRYMARQGIRQFLDIGSGLPTQQNTHEVAHEITPNARVVYIDNDPVVQAFGRALLATDDNTTVASADMHRPADVLDHPETRKLIDFNEPVGVLMIAMVHFLTDEERPSVMAHLRDALAPGSFLTTTHITKDGKSPDVVTRIESIYANTPSPGYFRDHAEIARFFDGFDLIDPGLVTLDRWRPDPQDPAPEATGWWYGAVGRKN